MRSFDRRIEGLKDRKIEGLREGRWKMEEGRIEGLKD